MSVFSFLRMDVGWFGQALPGILIGVWEAPVATLDQFGVSPKVTVASVASV
jgi:hypothetical protein